ncbi:Dynactin subunit 2 [Ceratocystis lukuohia]|uniref:Dynactin subunit 2 n=1 Tax=Ceratocystis lukuohia TaxID=2019550 RepID=A0ABR4MND8_9PEZI
MALSNRKYAALPDLDSAPDIYETPGLTDDNSTVPGSTLRAQSELDFDEELDDNEGGISRSRLRINEARSRFNPANIDASTVDFSDRVDTKRKSYKTSSRRRRILSDNTEEYGDFSDEEDDESLERKIARLTREVEEAKEQYGKRQLEQQANSEQQLEGKQEALESLGKILEDISRPYGNQVTPHIPRHLTTAPAEQSEETEALETTKQDATYTITYNPAYEQTHALAKVAEFDARLLALEKSLGSNSTLGLELDSNGMPRAILPTLDILQKQVSTLSQASTATLDSISRRVRILTQEADQLTKSRKEAKEAQEALDGAKEGDGSCDQESKINALYGTLPTIENLAPLLPSILDRLRSLRTIHSDAASASDILSRVEKQQTEMALELKQWREGLTKIETAIQEGSTTMQGNTKVMEEWVKDLEARVAKFES